MRSLRPLLSARAPLAAAFLIAFLTLAAHAAPAAGTLVSGPMLGYRTQRETLIWLKTKDASSVSLTYQIRNQSDSVRTITQSRLRVTPAGTQPMKFILPLLEPGRIYDYSIAIDGVDQSFPYPLTFKTAPDWEWRAPPPDFNFIFGSCAYLNDPPFDRPGKPYGQGTEIFRHMALSGADFMIWGGDNWYLREADYSSESGIWYRYSHDRATPDLQPLYAAMNHYAIWDDHDFGPDDSNRSYALKDVTLDAFQTYWGNATWGEADNAGIYGKFYFGDAVFILMDNRYHRDGDHLDDATHPEKSQYGRRQREWLEQSLLEAETLKHFPFKFIVTGGQVLTSFGGWSETFEYYQKERGEILKFITDQHITGVVFLSGDVHFTELARKQLGATQWTYELTSSPFSSGPQYAALKQRSEDPQRVPGTFVVDNNYCVLSLHGAPEKRMLTIRCLDKRGVQRWSQDIPLTQLQ